MSTYLLEDEAIASLFPLDLSGDVVALRACIDAGAQGPVFCVAAVAFGYDRAVKANREWEKLLKGRTFHMTDLNSRHGDFEGIERDEVNAIMRGTVEIIREYASFIVAVSCDADLVADSLPVTASRHPDMEHLLAAFKSTYGLMCHLAMTAVGTRANPDNTRKGQNISYVFERGDDGQRGLRKYLEFLGDEPYHDLFLNGYSHNRSTVADKDDIEGVFHASDLIAWEWARHVGRHNDGDPMRKSLAEIVGNLPAVMDEHGLTVSDGNRIFLRHFVPKSIGMLAGYFRDMLAATTLEEMEGLLAARRIIDYLGR